MEIDNNLIENATCNGTIGKKNRLFFGTPDSGWKAVILLTLLGNFKVMSIDPHAYLKDELEHLPSMMDSETPNLQPGNQAKQQTESGKLAG